MEDNIKDKSEEKIPGPAIRPGGQGFTIKPVSPPPSPQPAVPIPKISAPLPPVSPLPEPLKEKKNFTTFFLVLAIILNIFSLGLLISIGSNKIPDFLTKFLK